MGSILATHFLFMENIRDTLESRQNFFILLAKKYNTDVTEIGGYDWTFRPPKREEDQNDLVRELLDYGKDLPNYEVNIERERGGAYNSIIMIEVKGLICQSDFYQGSKSLYEAPDFWNGKPEALGYIDEEREKKIKAEREHILAEEKEKEEYEELKKKFEEPQETEYEKYLRLKKKYDNK